MRSDASRCRGLPVLPRGVAAQQRYDQSVVKRLLPRFTAALLPLTLCACLDLHESPKRCSDARVYCEPTVRGPENPEGDTYQFVVDSIHLPEGAVDAQSLGFDLDGDPQCRPDNSLGQILSTVFNWLDTPGNEILADSIADGRIVHLVSVRSTSLADAEGVSVSVYIGVDTDGDPTDNFSGAETFDIDAQIASVSMPGNIIDGVITAELGTVPLQIALPGVDEPFVMSLNAPRLRATIEDGVLEAGLGGSLTEKQVHDELLVVAWTAFDGIIADDCPNGACTPDTRGETLVDLFDTDGDGAVALDEFRTNDLVLLLVAPDVDLNDQAGAHNPRCDGVNESSSVGVSFTAVPAVF
jgi:hypothetical protein